MSNVSLTTTWEATQPATHVPNIAENAFLRASVSNATLEDMSKVIPASFATLLAVNGAHILLVWNVFNITC